MKAAMKTVRRSAFRAAFAAALLASFAPAFPGRAQEPPRPHKPRHDRKDNRKDDHKNAAADPVRLIERMVKAGVDKSFLGREITLTANGKETEQWIQRQPQKGVRIQNLRPNPGDVLLDDYKNQWVYSAQTKQWRQKESLLPKLHGRIQDVLERIRRGDLKAELLGQDKVAGRSADMVRVGPPLGVSAPSRKFWVDKKTGLRLKMEEIAPDGRILAASYFVFVDTSPKFGPNDFSPPPAGAPVSGEADAHSRPLKAGIVRRTYKTFDEAAQAGAIPRRPGYLPTGFVLRVVEAAGSEKPDKNTRITQRYANGLTVLSLTQTGRKLPIPPRLAEGLGPNQTGFVTLRGTVRAYVWHDTTSGLFFALIGSLPDNQLKKIADSVR